MVWTPIPLDACPLSINIYMAQTVHRKGSVLTMVNPEREREKERARIFCTAATVDQEHHGDKNEISVSEGSTHLSS
jgi:hypothetical protein